MTGYGPFGKTICCHPELVSGSGFYPLNGGGRTVDWLTFFISVQRVLAPKRERLLDRDSD